MALAMYQVSQGLFWQMLPVAFLLALFLMYAKGEISGSKLESLLRRVLVAVALYVAFPEISSYATGLETYLVQAFGGEASLSQIFSQVANRAKDIRTAGISDWLKIGQMGLTLIATLSFLVLSIVRHFLDVLHLTTWNLLNILGPLTLVGCLFDSWQQVPKGIFIGMLELSLWKPIWVILARLLIAIGFGETPADPSQWFDTAVMNFAVAGLMASTPIIVHGVLSGTLGSVGAGVFQTALSGTGALLASAPMRFISRGVSEAKSRTVSTVRAAGSSAITIIRTEMGAPPKNPGGGTPGKTMKGKN